MTRPLLTPITKWQAISKIHFGKAEQEWVKPIWAKLSQNLELTTFCTTKRINHTGTQLAQISQYLTTTQFTHGFRYIEIKTLTQSVRT